MVRQAFGISEREFDQRKYLSTKLVCTAEQFANFIILRNEQQVQNLIKELKPTWLDPAPVQTRSLIDVTDRAAA